MNRKMVLIMIFGLTLFGGNVWSESTLPTDNSLGVQTEKISQAQEMYEITQSLAMYTLETPVVCDFRQEAISQIAENLATQSRWKIVLDPLINGQVTLNIGQTTLGDALNRLCQTIGASWVRIGEETIEIILVDRQGPFAVQTEVVPINHLAAQQVLNLLALHPYSKLLALDERSNSLSITAPWSIIEEVKDLIRSLDTPKPRIMIEAMVIDTSNTNLRDRVSQFNLNSNSRLNTVQFAGSVFSWVDPDTGETLMALAYLDAHDQLKTLSNPKVTVMSGETAEISIGRDVYVPYYTPFGTAAPPAKIEPISTGNRLTVTPRVIEGGKIQMAIEAESSEIAGTGPAGFPIVYRRRAKSPVLEVWDGETVIIGGLSSSLEYRYQGKFPILGDLPLIGNLFRSSRRRTEKQEVTILITPMIVIHEVIEPAVERAKKKTEERAPDLEEERPPRQH